MNTPLRPRRPRTAPRLLAACLVGDEPAEILPPSYKDEVVRRLHACGWTDAEIATHTRMTTYTACRIRERLALTANDGIADETGAAS